MKNYVSTILILILTNTMFLTEAQTNKDAMPIKSVSEEEESLMELTEKAKRSLLVILQVGQEVLSETGAQGTVSAQAQILNDRTLVYASRFDTTTWMDQIDRNQSFDVLRQEAGFLKLRLSTTETGWILEKRARLISSPSILNKEVTVLSKSSRRNIEIIHRLYAGIQEINQRFKQLYNRLRTHSELARALQIEIRRYIVNADNYYQNNFDKISVEQPLYVQTIDRFSGQIQLGIGSSTFSDQYSESLSEEFKGRLSDISVKGAYQIDQSTNLNMVVDTRTELLETHFRSNKYQLGLQHRKDATKFDVRLGINQYIDSFRNVNSYDRLHLATNLRHVLNKKNKLTVSYQLVNNRYRSDEATDYSRHQLRVSSEKHTKANNVILTAFRGNLSTSERQHLDFIHLLPSITFRKTRHQNSTDLSLIYESFIYQELNLRNSHRGSIRFSKKKRTDLGKVIRNDALLSYISHPTNMMVDHARISIKKSKNDYTNGNTFSNFDITSKYFLHNPQISYVDIRYDAGYSNKLFTQLSLFQRLYYPDQSFHASVEANLKLGLQLEGFRIGPVISARCNMDLMDPKFKNDGSYYKLGAFIDGSRSFKNGLRLAINGAYEYGDVFSEDVIVDTQSGQLNTQSANSRTPTTLRFSATAGAKIFKIFDIFASIDYYKIDRNHKPIAGLNPILSSDRLSFKIGMTYRYN